MKDAGRRTLAQTKDETRDDPSGSQWERGAGTASTCTRASSTHNARHTWFALTLRALLPQCACLYLDARLDSSSSCLRSAIGQRLRVLAVEPAGALRAAGARYVTRCCNITPAHTHAVSYALPHDPSPPQHAHARAPLAKPGSRRGRLAWRAAAAACKLKSTPLG